MRHLLPSKLLTGSWKSLCLALCEWRHTCRCMSHFKCAVLLGALLPNDVVCLDPSRACLSPLQLEGCGEQNPGGSCTTCQGMALFSLLCLLLDETERMQRA